MDKRTYEQLRLKLDEQIFKLKVSHPVPRPAGNPHPAGLLITKDMDVDKVPQNQLPLMHTMLHMFYGNNSGMGLTKKSIENLHKRVVERLNGHSEYDRLDTHGFP